MLRMARVSTKSPATPPTADANYPTKVLWGDTHLPTYDAKRFGIEMPEDVPMTVTDRAYTSAIWYTP